MCFSMSVSVVMVGIGGAATALTIQRGDTPAVPLTLGYFTTKLHRQCWQVS